ncbi:hypothetical protein [uncultured Chitinophaga sp.]|jgi:hypothetical protein|uniref:hypothetical protein n=1 Tax=uncultured Chitinophaga sp. TaxID=339340 RepID=UPI002618E869|nr:hypothetical protein [uncultured Chitinophaga sp.]
MKSNFCFNRIFAVVITMVAVATIFFACSKSNDGAADPKTDENDNKAIAAATYEAQASALYDDLFDVALQGAEAEGYQSDARLAPRDKKNGKIGTCWVSTVDDATPGRWPKELTMDFGTQCAGDDGRVRTGKVHLTISNFILLPGATVTIEPENYTVNGIKLEGKKIITNLSNSNGFSYKTEVIDGKLTLDSQVFGYTSNKTITQTDGAATPLYTNDDIYSGTGTATLTLPGGSSVTYTVKEPLVKALKCAWIGQGTADVTIDQITATINYGAGLCDDSATISIGDKVKGILMK